MKHLLLVVGVIQIQPWKTFRIFKKILVVLHNKVQSWQKIFPVALCREIYAKNQLRKPFQTFSSELTVPLLRVGR